MVDPTPHSGGTGLAAALERLDLDDHATWQDLVRRVQALPYRRPSEPGPRGVLVEGCGTCSGKHYLLHDLLRQGWPDLDVTVVHRVYELTPDVARGVFGADIAAAVPEAGLADVHTYLRVRVPNGEIWDVDATMPADTAWQGDTSMPLACGPGTDHPATQDPAILKAALVAQFCDPAVREPFIDALSGEDG